MATVGRAVGVSTPRALYRYLLRRVAVLPQDAQEYYRHRIRQVILCMHTCKTVWERGLAAS